MFVCARGIVLVMRVWVAPNNGSGSLSATRAEVLSGDVLRRAKTLTEQESELLGACRTPTRTRTAPAMKDFLHHTKIRHSDDLMLSGGRGQKRAFRHLDTRTCRNSPCDLLTTESFHGRFSMWPPRLAHPWLT